MATIGSLAQFSETLLGAALDAIGRRPKAGSDTAHTFSFVSIDGTPLPLADFAGRPVLLVNTASSCGFASQYQEMEQLWQRYRANGLVVMGTPSADFGGQERRGDSELMDYCERTYGIDFPITQRVGVWGGKAHPFYRWAADHLGPFHRPSWNFTKILLDRQGRIAGAWGPFIKPMSSRIVAAVEQSLAQSDEAGTTLQPSEATG